MNRFWVRYVYVTLKLKEQGLKNVSFVGSLKRMARTAKSVKC